MSKHSGGWYWMTIMNPEFYFLAKSLGGDAADQADGAMEDVAPVLAVIAIVAVAIGIGWIIGMAVGAW